MLTRRPRKRHARASIILRRGFRDQLKFAAIRAGHVWPGRAIGILKIGINLRDTRTVLPLLPKSRSAVFHSKRVLNINPDPSRPDPTRPDTRRRGAAENIMRARFVR